MDPWLLPGGSIVAIFHQVVRCSKPAQSTAARVSKSGIACTPDEQSGLIDGAIP
jgi:hypothetical protein